MKIGDIKNSTGTWTGLGKELKKRTVEPLGHPSFVIYFVVAQIIAGGAGIWLELCTYLLSSSPTSLAALRTALITFFPAVVGSACLQIIWAEDDNRTLRAFATFMLIVMSIFALLIGLLTVIPNCRAILLGACASAVSLWVWWIANAKQKDLLDPDAALGGDTDSGLPGDLSKFKVE